MPYGDLAPQALYLNMDERPSVVECRLDDRFSVARVAVTKARPEPIRKTSTVPAMLVAVALGPALPGDVRVELDGKVVRARNAKAFRSAVVDLAAEPALCSSSGFDQVHFNLRRTVLDELASDLGFDRVGEFRLAIGQDDLVLAQVAKSVLPVVDGAAASTSVALDHLELILGAHLVQRYAGLRRRRAITRSGLAAWQRRRATELLRENLEGNVRLADVAAACDLSSSHFSRAFRASFGVSPHRWLTQRRIDCAKQLLEATAVPLADVAVRSGFADQSTFTRVFHRLVGVPPGHWRREHTVLAQKVKTRHG